jgi:hypothetical protein
VQITVADRGAQQFGKRDRFGGAPRHNDSATGQNDRKSGGGERFGRCIERGGITGSPGNSHRCWDGGFDFTIIEVTRNVELGRSQFEHGAVEAARRDFRHALGIVDVSLVLGDLREDGKLLGFLKPAEPHRHRARFGRDENNR